MKVTSTALPLYWSRLTGWPSESFRARGGAGFDGGARTPANFGVALADALPPLPPQPPRSGGGARRHQGERQTRACAPKPRRGWLNKPLTVLRPTTRERRGARSSFRGEDAQVASRPARGERIEEAGALEALPVDEIDRRCRVRAGPTVITRYALSTGASWSLEPSSQCQPAADPRPQRATAARVDSGVSWDGSRLTMTSAGRAGGGSSRSAVRSDRASGAQAWRQRELKKASITVRPRSDASETGRPLWSGSRKSGAGLSPGFQVAWPCRPGGLSRVARATSVVQRVDHDSGADPGDDRRQDDQAGCPEPGPAAAHRSGADRCPGVTLGGAGSAAACTRPGPRGR